MQQLNKIFLIFSASDGSKLISMLNQAGMTIADIFENELEREKLENMEKIPSMEVVTPEKEMQERVKKVIKEIMENEYTSLKPEVGKELIEKLEQNANYIVENVLSDDEESLSGNFKINIYLHIFNIKKCIGSKNFFY